MDTLYGFRLKVTPNGGSARVVDTAPGGNSANGVSADTNSLKWHIGNGGNSGGIGQKAQDRFEVHAGDIITITVGGGGAGSAGDGTINSSAGGSGALSSGRQGIGSNAIGSVDGASGGKSKGAGGNGGKASGSEGVASGGGGGAAGGFTLTSNNVSLTKL